MRDLGWQHQDQIRYEKLRKSFILHFKISFELIKIIFVAMFSKQVTAVRDMIFMADKTAFITSCHMVLGI